jgi:molybdopterin converting factor small subunit
VAEVTVNFLGVDLVGGGRKKTTLKVDGDMSLAELFSLLERQLGMEGFEESMHGRFLLLVNGTSIEWLRTSEVVVSPGSVISVAPLVAGGSR